MNPFDYPLNPLIRRHEPQGYDDYTSYRPWIRDEFIFRCVFCLRREQWGRAIGEFNLDHFLPISQGQQNIHDYKNLVYACNTCNNRKRDQLVLDPTEHRILATVSVAEDGSIIGHTHQSRRLILMLDFKGPELREFRLMWLDIIRLADLHDRSLLCKLLGFPDDLPDLSKLRPPGGNSKPAGIQQSHFQRRERGELPEFY
jgi:hypothetical protein